MACLDLPLHLNLSMCFSEVLVRWAVFRLEVLHKIPRDSNSIFYQKQSYNAQCEQRHY